MRVDFPLAHSLRKGSHQRHSGRLSRFLIVADVPVIDNIHAPVVFRLAVDGSTAFNADVDEVFAEKQPIGVERCVLLCAEQRGSGLDPEPDMTAEEDAAFDTDGLLFGEDRKSTRLNSSHLGMSYA